MGILRDIIDSDLQKKRDEKINKLEAYKFMLSQPDDKVDFSKKQQYLQLMMGDSPTSVKPLIERIGSALIHVGRKKKELESSTNTEQPTKGQDRDSGSPEGDPTEDQPKPIKGPLNKPVKSSAGPGFNTPEEQAAVQQKQMQQQVEFAAAKEKAVRVVKADAEVYNNRLRDQRIKDIYEGQDRDEIKQAKLQELLGDKFVSPFKVETGYLTSKDHSFSTPVNFHSLDRTKFMTRNAQGEPITVDLKTIPHGDGYELIDEPAHKALELEQQKAKDKIAEDKAKGESKPSAEMGADEKSRLWAEKHQNDPDPAVAKVARDKIKATAAQDAKKEDVGGAAGADIHMRSPTAPEGSRDESVLANEPSGVQSMVKELVDYKVPLPSAMALANAKSPWNRAIQLAGQYDPSFDASQYQVRMKLKNDFASGKSAQNIRSLNTAVGHLDTLSKAGRALNNTDFAILNRGKNFSKEQFGGYPQLKQFNEAANAVESELATAFKGTGATDQEIKAWRENLHASQTPREIQASIGTAIELLNSRLDALRTQYEQGMGRPPAVPFLTPHSEQVLRGLRGGGGTVKMRAPNGQVSDVSQAEVEHYKSRGAVVVQ